MATPPASAKKEPIPSIPLKINNIKEAVVVKEYLRSRLFTPELLDGLKQLYNCDIQNSKSVVGEITYLNFIIKPNDCNYFIHVKETTYTPRETILSFRFSLKQDDKTITDYEPGFTSTYIVKDNKIQHLYINDHEDVKPKKSTKKKTIFNDKKFVIFFNPYIKLNALLLKTGLRDRIDSRTLLSDIKSLILKIDTSKLSDEENSDLERIQNIFSTQHKKHSYDNRLREMIQYSYRGEPKKIEGIEQIYENYVLYETNLPVNNMLGNRYAQYYPDFEFNKVIKSLKLNPELPYDKIITDANLVKLMKANGINLADSTTNPQLYTRQREEFKRSLKYKYVNHEYIKYIPFGLNRPFTISDLVSYKFSEFAYVDNNLKIVNTLHYSDLSFDAKNIFNLNNEVSISRAFDLIELAKSIMFTYISFYDSICGKRSLSIPFRLFNVYPKLPWANNVLRENNIIVRAFNPPFLRSLLISIDSKGRDQILTINMKNENKLHKEPINVDYLLPCDEAPFTLMDGIIREPYMSIQELNSVQPVYSGEAHSMTFDGLENEFIEDPDVNQRLRERKHFSVDTKHFNQQLVSLNINTDDDITEEINPDLPEFEFDAISSDFQQPKAATNRISPKAEALLVVMRETGEARRKEMAPHLAELEAKKAAAERKRAEEATQLKQREAERDRIDAESHQSYQEDEGGEPSGRKQVSDKIEVMHNFGELEVQLFTYQKRSKETYELIKKYESELSKLSDIDSQTDRKGKKQQSSEQSDLSAKINQLNQKIDELNKENESYKDQIFRISKKLGRPANISGKRVEDQFIPKGAYSLLPSNYMNASKGKKNSKEKYLKYKAKYLALKQQYNL